MTLFAILIVIALVCAILSLIPKIGCPLAVSVILICVALLVRSYGS